MVILFSGDGSNLAKSPAFRVAFFAAHHCINHGSYIRRHNSHDALKEKSH
jgi:hypothetical protein